MPAMSSVETATDASRRLADALANLTLAAPFSRFGAQTMDAIWQLADIFATTGTPPRNPTPPTRNTRALVQLPRLHQTTDPQATPRVPPSTCSASKPYIKTTPIPTTKGGAPHTQPTPQVPSALTRTDQPYSGYCRGRRRSLPRGTWPRHRKN